MVPTWVSLDPSWSLQNVQAAINVIIAFLCAGAIFVLVRHFWVASARKIAKSQDVPAYSLLSLNTMGEIIDIVWLLRKDLFSKHYRGLLVQCICVLILTACALMSGFIARFATRSSAVVVQRNITGNRAQPNDIVSSYSTLEINNAMTNLQKANFEQNQLVDFWPDPNSQWQYNSDQWGNASWSMTCRYNETSKAPNPRSTGDCSDNLWTLFPAMQDYWKDWKFDNQSDMGYDSGGWYRTNSTDWLMFAHGYQFLDWNSTYWLSMKIRTVATYIEGAPKAASNSSCYFGKGNINSAISTSMTCTLTRVFEDEQKKNGQDYWRARPDSYKAIPMAESYNAYYASRFQREAASQSAVTMATGRELVTYFQAWMITHDTGGFLYDNTTSTVRDTGRSWRTIDARRNVAQIHIACLITCSVGLFLVLCGLIYYWTFLWRHWASLDMTPQSKLDWMLHTIRQEHNDDNTKLKQKLRNSIAPGTRASDTIPLTDLEQDDDLRNRKSATSSITTHEAEIVDVSETPALGSDFLGGTHTSRSVWSPYNRQNLGSVVYNGLGISGRGDYNPVHSANQPWDTPGFDTTYDPGRR